MIDSRASQQHLPHFNTDKRSFTALRYVLHYVYEIWGSSLHYSSQTASITWRLNTTITKALHWTESWMHSIHLQY